MTITCDRAGRVSAAISLDLPLAAISVWGQMRDLPGFATLDPFHDRIELLSNADGGPPPRPAPGVAIRLHHRCGPIRPVRKGRILAWREGCEYSFSDLSQRGTSVGFPHIYTYRVERLGEGASRLSLTVRGR